MAEFREATETSVKRLISSEILAELAQARKDFLNGEDFDEAVAEISAKYSLEA